MISYYSGNQLTVLADHLSDCLKSQTPDDPFQSQTILVPNRDSAKWLQLHLSEKMGIAANYRFMMPAEWHWKRIREIYPDLPKVLPSDPEPMKWTLFSLLTDPGVLKRFSRLYNYISEQSDEMREPATLKLSRQLASVYDQYLIYRPEMILKWDAGNTGSGDEKWQAELWQLLTKRWENSFETPICYHKAKLFDIAEKEFKRKDSVSKTPLFVFNPGLIPASIARFLKVYSENHPIHLFQNRVTESISSEYDCSILNSLAEETVSIDSIYQSIVDDEVQEFCEFDSITLLSEVKNRISKNRSDKKYEFDVDDKSIQIRSCHSPLREIETLHQFLLEQFERDPSLKPDDVLVVTPDLAPYEKVIDAVFGVKEEGLPAIPYRTPSSGFQQSLQIVNTFLDFLHLITSRFEFNDVFDLFETKPILERFEIAESDASRIKEWLEDNYIIWGIDEEHRKEWGQPEQKTHTWKRAMQRIWDGDIIGSNRAEELGFERYEGVKTITDRDRWAAFNRYFNFLNDCRQIAKHPKMAGQWCDLLTRWASELFSDGVISDGAGNTLKSGIESLRSQFEASSVDGKISFKLIRSEIEAVLENRTGRSARFTDGVTFSSMVPVRGLPFKLIAMIGLNEETFPRKQNAPDFDLMNQNPRVTERDRKKEDKALFLESVLAAGEIHYCSYIGQSKVDNEHLPPSPIVSEWIDYLSRITGKKRESWVQYEAISGFSPNAFTNGKTYSEAYHRAMQATISDTSDRKGGIQFRKPVEIEEAQTDVELSDLIRFYTKHPDWFLRNRFDARPRDPEEDRDEFSLSALEKHQLFRQIFSWRLSGIEQEQIQPVVLESGVVPAGWGGRKELNELSKSVDTAFEVLDELNINPELTYIDLDIKLKDNRLTGLVENYSSKGLVQINPSSKRGGNLFKAWLNHLAVQASGLFENPESRFIIDLKKGEPVVITFNPVEDPKQLLGELMDEYRKFSVKPMKFFPNVIYEYLDKSPDKDPEKALSAARTKFEGSQFSPFAERDNLSVKLLYGPNVEFSEELLDETYLKWMETMNEHMTEEG
ncbi:exodeoxyribonuclease V subunit gamma [Rhodohalobacter sp.]|uniref:exodeoxyribonuclease V subunit gamma n=1 Tax=Rhodohalobacter sp. TaxID=1974210 RepID=UPI002ACED96E|nr:exodeoxyribonuclease V subunit gamma [Rhodohalobacter sp.]MDZ7757545.1 exodeoxyribonuclease V subunit gamma [Rhodohalobacter sp.]